MNTMVLLTVIPAIRHRKTIFVAALYLLIITLLVTGCQSLDSGRTVQNMRNPRIATDKCGREGVISNVCDPDNVITFGEGMLLNWILLLFLLCIDIRYIVNAVIFLVIV